MNQETIVVVAGLGRCGSSLMMRMLHAGGVPVYCDNYASYETTKIQGLPTNWTWLNETKGKAIKVLDPHQWKLHPSLNYKIIWLYRNTTEQAKSALKLLVETRTIATYNRAKVREMAQVYEKDMRLANRSLVALNSELLKISFEELITSAKATSKKVEDFLGLNLNLEKMVSQVKPRTTACLPYLMEYAHLT